MMYIKFNENPIYNDINECFGDLMEIDSINIYTRNMRIIQNFKEIYYTLKCKKGFMKFLWKIREPKIRAHYHPENLIKLLNENKYELNSEEFERMLDSW